MFDRESFTKVLAESGLRKGELAAIFEVSRQHLYNIAHGATPPSKLHNRLNLYCRAILKLLQLGALPLPNNIKGPQRQEAVTRLVQKLYDLARPE